MNKVIKSGMKNKKMLIVAALTLGVAVAAYCGVDIPATLIEPVTIAICALASC